MRPFEDPPCSLSVPLGMLLCLSRTLPCEDPPPYSPFGLLGTPPCPIPMLLFEDPLCALSVPLGTPLCSSFMLPFEDNPLPHLHAAF